MFRRNHKHQVKSSLTNPIEYPVGSAVRTEEGLFYIKSKTIRMRIPSERVLESWSFHRVITSNEVCLKSYKILGKLGFRSGSLLYNIATGKMYLVSENLLRHVQSPEALDLIGAVYDDAVTVSNTDIKLHDEGLPLT